MVASARWMTQAFDLLVLGDLNPDIVVLDPALEPVFGQVETLVGAIRLTIGGSVGDHGLRRGAAGAVGRVLRRRRRRRAGSLDARRSSRQRGVDTRHCVAWTRRSPTGATVVLARGDDRAILTAHGHHRPAAGRGHPDRAAGRGHATCTSARTALQPQLRRGPAGPVPGTRARRARRPRSTPTGTPRSAGRTSTRCSRRADICFPNLAEGRRWTGLTDPDDGGARASWRAAARAGRDRGRRARSRWRSSWAARVRSRCAATELVAGRRAARGGGRHDGRRRLASMPGSWPRSLHGWPLERTLAFAVACGSASTRAVGGVDAQPTLEEALALLALRIARSGLLALDLGLGRRPTRGAAAGR